MAKMLSEIRARSEWKALDKEPTQSLRMIATAHGLIFWNYELPGVWFIPQSDLDRAAH